MGNLASNHRVSTLFVFLVLVCFAHSGAFAAGPDAASPGSETAEDARYEVFGVTVTSEGGALPGVMVAVSGNESNFRTVSDAEGAFSLTAVPPGDYAVEFKASGRKKVKLKITVSDADVDMGKITLE
jgi:hypothetical protein